MRIGSWRIKIDAEGLLQSTGEYGDFLGLAPAGDSPENPDVAGFGLSHEKIAIGSGTNDSRIVQAGSVLLYVETRWNLRPCAFGTGNNFRPVARGCRREWSGKIS